MLEKLLENIIEDIIDNIILYKLYKGGKKMDRRYNRLDDIIEHYDDLIFDKEHDEHEYRRGVPRKW